MYHTYQRTAMIKYGIVFDVKNYTLKMPYVNPLKPVYLVRDYSIVTCA